MAILLCFLLPSSYFFLFITLPCLCVCLSVLQLYVDFSVFFFFRMAKYIFPLYCDQGIITHPLPNSSLSQLLNYYS